MPSLSALVNHRKNRYKQFAPATPSRVTGADYAPKEVAIQHEALVFHLSSCIISSFSQYSRLFSVIYHRVNHIHSCPGKRQTCYAQEEMICMESIKQNIGYRGAFWAIFLRKYNTISTSCTYSFLSVFSICTLYSNCF